FQQSQLLQQHRSLTPRAGLVDAVATIIIAHRLLERSAPIRHVLSGQNRDVASAAPVHLRGSGRESIDRLSHEATIEGVARRLDLPLAVAPDRFRFGEDSLICLSDSGGDEQRPRPGRLTAWQPY